MELSVIIGLGAFVILGIMFALLWASGRRADPITEDIIVRVTTGAVDTQENED